MDNNNVITPSIDNEELSKDMANWNAMTYDQRKRSDEECIKKYGRTNTELYELLKKNNSLASDKIVEESSRTERFYTKLKAELAKSDEITTAQKLDQSFKLEQELGIVIINPWLVDGRPDYSENDLEDKYIRFMNLEDGLKIMSNEHSESIWGYDVYNLYQIMKNKFSTIKAEKDFQKPLVDRQLSEFVNFVRNNEVHGDALQAKCRKLDIATHKGSLYEEAVLENLNEELDVASNSLTDYDEDIPMITPWFTPDEMRDLFSIEVDPYEYIVDGTKAMELHEKIREAMYNGVEKDIIALGWNPSVPYNGETQKYARSRQVKWFNDHKQIQIIDISKYDFVSEAENAIVKLEPIYITLINHGGATSKVIRGFTHSRWSHAGISLDDKMDCIYSFNFKDPTGKSGFSIESLDFYENSKKPNLKVMAFFVTPETKSNLKKNINYFVKNIGKSSYSLKNIFKFALNLASDTAYSLSMICSQFVDSILKSVDLDLTGKPSNLVAPGDFERVSTMTKMFTVYDGTVNDYKSGLVKKKVRNLLASDLNPEGLILKPVTEVIEGIFQKRCMDSFYVITEDEKVNEILKEIRELLIPTAVITEAKPLPLRFGKSGNLFIEMPRNLEAEYQEAHRLLESYSENNIEGIKHQLARLFYINSIIENKIKKMKKGDKDYKVLIDLRARVLNDFKKYMTIVQNIEDNFDFEQYMKNSEYYNKTVVIDKHTMKYTGALIKSLIKIMV